MAEAGDGEAALAAVPRSDPDVVLVDVRLGRESGYDLARALNMRWPEVAVLLMSVGAVSRSALEACGARGYLLKHRLNVDLVELLR